MTTPKTKQYRGIDTSKHTGTKFWMFECEICKQQFGVIVGQPKSVYTHYGKVICKGLNCQLQAKEQKLDSEINKK